jgi:Cu(I)/Ag(I) efflux system membrane fusion protein
MKKLLPFISFFLFMACSGNKSENDKVAQISVEEKKLSALSDTFNSSFQNLLTTYYALRDALVAGDTAQANAASSLLITVVGEVKLDDLKSADTANIIIPTAKTYTDGIANETKGLLGESDIEQKRKAFQMISIQLFDLVRTVRYEKQKVYMLHCPMAFDNAGAKWLSNTTEIKNPYFGSKMLTCGTVIDSVVLK